MSARWGKHLGRFGRPLRSAARIPFQAYSCQRTVTRANGQALALAASSTTSFRDCRHFSAGQASSSSSSSSSSRTFSSVDEPPAAHLSYRVKDIKDISTLLLVARSAALSDYEDAKFWRHCSLVGQRLLSTASPSELSQLLVAVADAGVRDDELMYNIGDACVASDKKSLDTDTVARLLQAHAALEVRNDRVIDKMKEALYEQMQESRATASGLAAAYLHLAKLTQSGCTSRPSQDLLEAVVRMVSQHLSFFTVPQLSQVLEGHILFGMRGDRQTASLLTGIGSVFAREAEQLSAKDCAIAVKGFAKCRVHDEHLMNTVANRLRERGVREELDPTQLSDSLYGFAKFTCQDTALLDLLSIEARRSLHLMDIATMSQVVASLAKAGVSSLVLTNRVASTVKRADEAWLDEATLPQLQVLNMAFGKLQVNDGPLFDTCAASYLRRSGAEGVTLPTASCELLVNVIHAYAKVHHFHAELFATINAILIDRFEEVTMTDLVKYLHAISKVEHLPPPPLQQRILERLQSDKLNALGVFDLLKVATAVRRLGIRVPSLESYVSQVLPQETDSSAVGGLGPSSRRLKRGPNKRRQSARKRKWTW